MTATADLQWLTCTKHESVLNFYFSTLASYIAVLYDQPYSYVVVLGPVC